MKNSDRPLIVFIIAYPISPFVYSATKQTIFDQGALGVQKLPNKTRVVTIYSEKMLTSVHSSYIKPF